MTPQQEREYVEARWERVTYCEDYPYPSPSLFIAPFEHGWNAEFHCASEGECWHAAVLFTKQRDRQIAEEVRILDMLSRIIYFMRGEIACSGGIKSREQELVDWISLKDREQSRLADLRRGLREVPQ